MLFFYSSKNPKIISGYKEVLSSTAVSNTDNKSAY